MTAEATVPPSPKAPADAKAVASKSAGKERKARPVRVGTARAKTVKKTDASAHTSAPRTSKKVETSHRLRIRVRAYEHGVLDGAVKQIIDVAARHNAEVIGPVPLPIDIKKYTVNRAAFIDKDSREQFEMRIHKRMIDILNPAPKVIEALTNIDLPSGVNIDVKMM